MIPSGGRCLPSRLQDYALLQTVGIKPDDPLLAPLKSYAEFPKNEEWIDNAVRAVLKRAG